MFLRMRLVCRTNKRNLLSAILFSDILFCGVAILEMRLGGCAVYLLCTAKPAFVVFWDFWDFVESITCVFSEAGHGSIPSLATCFSIAYKGIQSQIPKEHSPFIYFMYCRTAFLNGGLLRNTGRYHCAVTTLLISLLRVGQICAPSRLNAAEVNQINARSE